MEKLRLPEAIDEWSGRVPFAFRMAQWLSRHAPRGKGWFPRQIGRHLCRDDKFFVVTRTGAKLAVESQSLEYFAVMMNRGGVIDAHICDVCTSFLKPGDVFYDIGANVGMIAAEVARRLDGSVHVVAFEPQTKLADKLAITGRLNGFERWDVFPIMLSDREGVDELFLSSSTIHASRVGRGKHATRLVRPVSTIDSLVANGVIPAPDVIKLDVEGGEWDVLRGAQETLRAHTPVIIFEADVNMARFGYGRKELFDHIHSSGAYRISGVDEAGVHSIDEANAEAFDNFVAVPVTSDVAKNASFV